jgi:pimeloyl-ACP methyl ester carboxylesterase
MAPKAEKRVDDDGKKYTRDQFIEYYGQKQGTKRWTAASVTTSGSNVDYSALEKGMRLQAEADGKWWAAEVVAVSKKRGSKTPVKVNYVGYASGSDEWLGADRLRSKALTTKGSKEETDAAKSGLSRGLVSTPFGHIHYTDNGARGGRALPLVCLHMSPRSTDEYREIAALFASKGRRVIAVDEPGYGCSDNPSKDMTLQDVADTVLAVVNHLGLRRFIAVGSLMGCFTSLSLASRFKGRIPAVVLTHPFMWSDEAVAEAVAKEDAKAKEGAGGLSQPPPDLPEDGSHLVGYWDTRKGFLTPEMNNRCVLDNFLYEAKKRERAGVSIQAPQLFPFNDVASAVKSKALVIVGAKAEAFFDMIGMNGTEAFSRATKALSAAEVSSKRIEEGHMNLVSTHAPEWLDHVQSFLDNHKLWWWRHWWGRSNLCW